MLDARRIYTFFLRAAFMGLFLFIVTFLGYGAIRDGTLFNGVTFIYVVIVVLRAISVWLFPDARGLIEGPRERIANYWATMSRVVLLGPIIAFFTVMKVQATTGTEGLEILVQIQLVLFVLNILIFGLWLWLSHKHGNRRYGYG